MATLHKLLVASLLASLAGCSGSAPLAPSPAPQSFVVSGILSETVDGVSHPLAGHPVTLYNFPDVTDQWGNILWKVQVAHTDSDGRYIDQVSKGRVFVRGFDLPETEQPCLASAAVDHDTTIDVQILPADRPAVLPPEASPMITGVVYEVSPHGRRAVRGAYVWLFVHQEFGVAGTHTDDAGQFRLCRVDAPVQILIEGPPEYQPWSQIIPAAGDMFLEVELTR